MNDEYERFRLSGLWHVHTDRTDGSHSVEELVSFAVENGFPLLGIAEHVRRDLTYDFDALYDETKRHARERDLRAVVGCEAKVLDEDGSLDASAETLDRADVVYAAYHGTPFSRDEYLDSLLSTLSNPAVDVWAHPFSYAERKGYEFTDEEYAAVSDALRDNGVLFEANVRKPTRRLIDRPGFRGVRRIVGYDLHDIGRWTAARDESGAFVPERTDGGNTVGETR